MQEHSKVDPVVVLTWQMKEKDVIDSHKFGVNGYLVKLLS
jgi:DNA-binding NarL/FixJ family response regulator